jgi:tRNA (cmo5U34)-methyltransferase
MRDEIIPGKEWSFNEDVANVFDDMLGRSIPGYENMRDTVIKMISPIITNGGHILDLGCSHGEMIAKLIKDLGSSMYVNYVGVDSSTAMVSKARTRFADDERVTIVHGNIADAEMQRLRYDSILSILTLQFIPVEHRQDILKQVHDALTPNGCFILVEKVLGESSSGQDHLVSVYHQMKKDNGYSEEQVEAKRVSLQNVLVPLRASENIRMLKSAGFSVVQPFWQNLNFVGIYASKEK